MTSKPVVSISSLDQLDTENGDIFISHRKLKPSTETQPNNISLRDQVGLVLQKIDGDNFYTQLFLGRLHSLGFDEQILTNLLAGTPFFLRVLLPGAPVTPLNVPCFPWFFSMKKSTLAGSVAYFIYIMFTLSVLWSTEILSSMMYRPDKNTYFNFYFNDWCKRDIFATGYLCDTHHHTINTFFKHFLYGSNCYDICIGMSIMWFLIASMFDVGIFYSSRPGKYIYIICKKRTRRAIINIIF